MIEMIDIIIQIILPFLKMLQKVAFLTAELYLSQQSLDGDGSVCKFLAVHILLYLIVL